MSQVSAIEAKAQRWLDGELQRAAAAHGARWPEHEAWISGYLRAELRQRLIALGWRQR